MKRSASCFSLRELYPPVPMEESLKFEESVQKIINSKIKINKRYILSLVCLVIAGVILIIILGMTFIGAIIAFLIAICLIHILRQAWLKYKLNKNKLSKERSYEIRLSCLNIYLRRMKNSTLSLKDFQGLLEKIFQEFLPAILMRLNNPALHTQVQLLIKLLRSDVVHSCMLSSAIQLEFAICSKENPVSTAARLRQFYIPVMVLLKQPRSKEDRELEIVRRISEILSKEETQMLLLTSKISNDCFLKRISEFWQLSESFKRTYSMCKLFSDVERLCYPDQVGLSPKLMLFRRNSFDDNKEFKHKTRDKLLVVKRASENFEKKVDLSESVAELHEDTEKVLLKPEPIKLLHLASSPILSFTASKAPALFKGDNIKDIKAESDNDVASDNEYECVSKILIDKFNEYEEHKDYVESSIKIAVNEPEEEAYSNSDEPVKVIHPYMECFEELLSIEKEPSHEKVWKMVVNKPETKVYQKKVENSPMCMIKAFCDVKYSAKVVYTAIWDTAIRTQWDSVFHEFRLVDKQPDFEVLYYMIKTPFGITKRDWLQRRVEIHDYPEPGDIILHFVSMEHPLMPPKKGVIRAETLISGYVIRPTGETTCRVMIVSQNDVKGLIPKAIVNSVASKAPADWVNSMNRGCKLVAGY